METSSIDFAWLFFWLFKTLFIVGVVLFVIWASKLKQDELQKWVVWLLVVGIVGALITSAVYPDYKDKRFKKGKSAVEDVVGSGDGS